MQPITRETVVDRRQPAIRWSAVLAGTAVAVGLWGVLQVLGIGVGLSALDPDDASSMRAAVVGTGAWSVIAPLIALFVGGYVAGRMSNTFDRKVAASHALVTWGITATLGLVFTMWMAGHAAFGAAKQADQMDHRGMYRDDVAQTGIINDAQTEARDALVPINNRLRLQGKPTITADQLIAATRAASDDGELDRDDFVKTLAAKTSLTKDEATSVVTELGPRAAGLAVHADRATPQEHDAMNAAETAGKGMLALGLSLLFSIGTAILGALLALRRFHMDRDRRDGERIVTGTSTVHTTSQYPAATPTVPGV
jgi:predicted nucleic acid-binding protein